MVFLVYCVTSNQQEIESRPAGVGDTVYQSAAVLPDGQDHR
jgi:hypothetical protein